MKTEIINTTLLAGAFLALFGAAEFLYHFLKVKVELTRKLVHVGTGLLTLLFPILLNNHWLVLLLCLSFAGILVTSLKFDLLKSINAIKRKSYGSIAYPVSVYGCYLAFDFQNQNYIYFYLPILILAICDPVAALVGKKFPYGKFKVGCGTKTVMGSGMFFLSAFLISATFLNFSNIEITSTQILLQGGLIAVVAMLAEAVSGKGLDNITIPVAVLLTLGFVEQFKTVFGSFDCDVLSATYLEAPASKLIFPLGSWSFQVCKMKTNMKIIKTIPDDSNFHLFESLPQKLYSDKVLQQNGMENLNKDFLITCYVLLKNEEPQARLALYQNPHLIYNGMKTASIGNYESVDNIDFSTKLISLAISDAKKMGIQYLIGGMNGSTWDNYRFSTHHDSANFLLEPYHHLYYNDHFQAAGFSVMSKYFSSLDRQMIYDHPKVLQREKELMQEGLTIRKIDLENYENELKRLYPFVVNAFKGNFLYTPISWESFREKYSAAKKIINPEFVLLAEDDRKNIVGVFFCIPDLLNQNEKSLIFKTIARDPDEKWRGLGHVVGNRIYRSAARAGFKSAVHVFIIDHGTSTEISKSFSGESYKNYVLYGKEI